MSYKIIIPDVHQNIKRVNKILDQKEVQKADEIIFLGDYFDSYEYDSKTKETCEFLNSHVNDSKFTFLIGNHDVHYISTLRGYMCSGYSSKKNKIINENLGSSFREKMKLWKFDIIAGENTLFSHAGIHPNFLDESFEKNPTLWFDAKQQEVLDSMFRIEHELLGAGLDRGGYQLYGGVTWLDWNSFIPIINLNQVVGHSYGIICRFKNDISKNVCIDTDLNFYLKIYDDGQYEFNT